MFVEAGTVVELALGFILVETRSLTLNINAPASAFLSRLLAAALASVAVWTEWGLPVALVLIVSQQATLVHDVLWLCSRRHWRGWRRCGWTQTTCGSRTGCSWTSLRRRTSAFVAPRVARNQGCENCQTTALVQQAKQQRQQLSVVRRFIFAGASKDATAQQIQFTQYA